MTFEDFLKKPMNNQIDFESFSKYFNALLDFAWWATEELEKKEEETKLLWEQLDQLTDIVNKMSEHIKP